MDPSDIEDFPRGHGIDTVIVAAPDQVGAMTPRQTRIRVAADSIPPGGPCLRKHQLSSPDRVGNPLKAHT